MVFVKHQVQEIGGNEYEYYYLYQSYYEPSMKNPTNFKVGKVDDSIDSIMSSYREKAEGKGLNVSADEFESFRDKLKHIDENANSVEEKAEMIKEYQEDPDDHKDNSEDEESDSSSEENESDDYPERAEQHALVAPVKVSWSGKTRDKVRSDMQHVEILDPVFESQKTNIVVETEEQVNELLFRLHGKVKAEGDVWSTNNQKAIKRVHDEVVDEIEDQGYVIENHKIQELDPEDSSVKSESGQGMNEDAVKKLTSKGAMLEKDGAEILTEEDVKIIESLETTPMFVSETMIRKLRSKDKDVSSIDISNKAFDDDFEYRKVRMVTDVPKFVGVDLNEYGGFDEGDEVELPDPNAEILVNRGNAEEIDKEEVVNTKEKMEEQKDDVVDDDGFVEVEFLQKTPQFMGTDLESYGAFEKGDIAEIPRENAEILENRGNVKVKKGKSNGAEERNHSSKDKDDQDRSSERDIDDERLGVQIHRKVMDLDSGDGADYKKVLSHISDFTKDEVEQGINQLLDAGDLYEPRPGKLKVLDEDEDPVAVELKTEFEEEEIEEGIESVEGYLDGEGDEVEISVLKEEIGLDDDLVDKVLDRLKRKGSIFEPRQGSIEII